MKERNGIRPMVDHESRQPQRAIVEFLTFWFASEITVHGIESLKSTQELIAEGKKIIFAANHLSHADYPVVFEAIKRSKFGEIAGKLITLEGRRVEENKATKPFIPAYNTILIWPPTILPVNEDERQEKFSMDRKALRYAKWNLNHGYHLVIFPEGGRSKTGKLTYGYPGAAHFLTLVDNAFAVPVGIMGTENILPPGRFFPDRGYPTVTFGEPIRVDDIKEMFRHSGNQDMRKEMINFVMEGVADCLAPSYRGVYLKGSYAKA